MTDTTDIVAQPEVAKLPKWQSDVQADIKKIKTFAPHAKVMAERDANEADTRLLVTDILTEVLGWDKYTDISTEYQVRGEFADYALRFDGSVFAMVEVKRASMRLTDKHLRQIEAYGLREGADWLILTNAVEWRVYHLAQFGEGTKPTHVFTVDLSSVTKADMDNLAVLHKQAVKRNLPDALWRRVSALAPDNLDSVLLSDRVLNAIRLEVKSTVGYNATDAEVKAAIKRRLAA